MPLPLGVVVRDVRRGGGGDGGGAKGGEKPVLPLTKGIGVDIVHITSAFCCAFFGEKAPALPVYTH